MEIRRLTSNDLRSLPEIDATIESTEYLHIDKSGDGLAMSVRVEKRPMRAKQIVSNPMDDDLSLNARQIASGAFDGIGLVAEHDGQIVALSIAVPDPAMRTIKLLDVRVDYDFRRQGLATAMLFQVIQAARDAELRAVAAETLSNNIVANHLLLKLGFELSGVDVRRRSNHDMVKESATLFWYAALD